MENTVIPKTEKQVTSLMSVSIMWLDGDFSIAGNNWPSSGDQCETNEGKKINMVENILLYYYYYYYYFKTWCKIVSQLAFAGKAKEIF